MKFAKPALSVDAQLTLLQQRGMVIADVGEARHTLHHINSQTVWARKHVGSTTWSFAVKRFRATRWAMPMPHARGI